MLPPVQAPRGESLDRFLRVLQRVEPSLELLRVKIVARHRARVRHRSASRRRVTLSARASAGNTRDRVPVSSVPGDSRATRLEQPNQVASLARGAVNSDTRGGVRKTRGRARAFYDDSSSRAIPAAVVRLAPAAHDSLRLLVRIRERVSV